MWAMTSVAFVMDSRNLAGLVASLGCLLIVALVLVMLNDWDRPRSERGWQQSENLRGVFDERAEPDR